MGPTQCPVVDTQCPPVNTMCPAVNTMCPAIDTQCPAINTMCPAANTACPAVNTQCPAVNTQCPAADTQCPPTPTTCQGGNTQCPPVDTQCPSMNTMCPAVNTQCPTVDTQCPAVNTACPAADTQCPTVNTMCPATVATQCPATDTQCPVVGTMCPAADTKCPVVSTQCPPVSTQCPAVDTACPAVDTQCPAVATQCPPVDTQCPAMDTMCPAADTKCPAVATQCPSVSTQCPAVATQCPSVTTQCPAVETQCPAVETKCPPVSGGTDPGGMPVYQPGAAVDGLLRTKGSDLMPEVMNLWARAFVKYQPQVKFDIQSKGSVTAVPALIEKTADAGPMSRPIAPEEAAEFQKAYDVAPTSIVVGIDCEGVFVNKDNPVKGLTVLQLDGIFSKDLRSGHPDVSKWGEIGVADAEWANRMAKPFVKRGAPSLFKEVVLLGGEVKDAAADPGAGTLATAGRPPTALAVGNDPEAIQFAPLAYKKAGARLVPVSEDGTGPYVDASFANVLVGKYPVGSVLTINVVKKPDLPLSPVLREFLLFILSREGQEIAAKAGFGTLPAAIVLAERKKLE